jgi:hypothetical protein
MFNAGSENARLSLAAVLRATGGSLVQQTFLF